MTTEKAAPLVISGTFAFAKVTEPVNKYQSEDKEFSINLVVDKATAKAFGKQFPKQKGKVVDNEDFENIYKIEPVHPNQDEQYVLAFKKSAQYKDGTPIPTKYYPKLLLKKGTKAVPLEQGVLIANGSKGKISYEVVENSFGTFVKLKAVLVEELIEYKKQSSDAASDFGLETDYEADEFEQAAKPEVKQEKQEPKQVAAPAKAKAKVVEDLDDDIPF